MNFYLKKMNMNNKKKYEVLIAAKDKKIKDLREELNKLKKENEVLRGQLYEKL